MKAGGNCESWYFMIKQTYEIDYRGMDGFSRFCSLAAEKSGQYRFVAARERRGFNLIYRFWTGEKDLITTGGLLLRYREIAEEYAETGRFGPVLILDDLAVCGREISKVSAQLRSMVWEYLQETRPGAVSWDRFDRDFQRGMNVYVYAAGRSCRLLAQGPFLFRTFYGNFSSMRTIHDLSLQLSFAMAESEVANTCCSFAARSEWLWKFMTSEKAAVTKGWSRVVMDHQNEAVYIWMRPRGEGAVRGMSTLRVFPRRSRHRMPQVASFPLMGDMDGGTMELLYGRCRSFAADRGLENVARLLGVEHPYLRQVRVQLLEFILSAADLFGFCRDSLGEGETPELWADLKCDVRKTACCLGGGQEIFRDLLELAFDNGLPGWAESELWPVISLRARPLAHVDPETLAGFDIRAARSFRSGDCGPGASGSLSDVVGRFAYSLGEQNELRAAETAKAPYRFESLKYQTGDPRDGMAPLELAFARTLNGASSPQYFCGVAAALVAAVDRGLMGPVELAGDGGDASFWLKAGEMSAFYWIIKNAYMLPALALVEEYYYLRSDSRRGAVEKFLAETAMPRYDFIGHVYECGQTFRDWNIPNLVRMDGRDKLKARLLRSAEVFLRL